MRQRWEQLLFLHWQWDPAVVQRTLPGGLTVDTFDGRAWLGVVPFFMRAVRPAWFPPVPGLANFLELNVRTYVHDSQGRPGVWFYSLDCNQWFAVKVARAGFHLRYEHAKMAAATNERGEVGYRCQRRGDETESRFVYRATGSSRIAAPGTLEFFLVERYLLYAHNARRGQLFTGQVSHAPYQIREADVPVWDDWMLRLAGFDSPARAPDHLCAANPVSVRIYLPELVTASACGA